MIKDVYIWTNGMVAVFDEDGEQVTDLQGLLADVAEKISVVLHKQSNDYSIKFANWKDSVFLIMINLESFDRLWKRSVNLKMLLIM